MRLSAAIQPDETVVAALERLTEEALAARVLKVEHRIYPAALKLVAEGRVRVVDGRCLVDGAPVPDAGTLVASK